MDGKKENRQQARFLLVSKTPAGAMYLPNSSIAPTLPEPDKLFRVVLRFEPGREHYHPDNNDLQLTCAPALFHNLQEGMHGIGIWEKKTLLEFRPCD